MKNFFYRGLFTTPSTQKCAKIMGHRKQSAPRHGSLRFLPHKRSRKITGRIRNWLDYSGEPQLLGFAGFKAGMTHIAYIEDQETSPYHGTEIIKAVTIVETPPIILFGIKALKSTDYGKITLGQILAENTPAILGRKLNLPKDYDFGAKTAAFEDLLEDPDLELRGMFCTNPQLASLSRKRPDIIEIKVSGGQDSKDKYNYLQERLGEEFRIRDFAKEGEYIDVIAVSKGKGFQGPVKRFGIKLLPKKSRKTKRGVGCIGPWHPARVMYTVARAGQMGFHNRVEINKRMLKIGEKGEEITPKGGFIRYGIVKSDYIMILGSIPGSKKRLIRLRRPIRPKKRKVTTIPEITYISNASHQGRK